MVPERVAWERTCRSILREEYETAAEDEGPDVDVRRFAEDVLDTEDGMVDDTISGGLVSPQVHVASHGDLAAASGGVRQRRNSMSMGDRILRKQERVAEIEAARANKGHAHKPAAPRRPRSGSGHEIGREVCLIRNGQPTLAHPGRSGAGAGNGAGHPPVPPKGRHALTAARVTGRPTLSRGLLPPTAYEAERDLLADWSALGRHVFELRRERDDSLVMAAAASARSGHYYLTRSTTTFLPGSHHYLGATECNFLGTKYVAEVRLRCHVGQRARPRRGGGGAAYVCLDAWLITQWVD